MNKKWLALIAGSLFSLQAISQTLFTYGNHSVDAAEFLRAYNKNNTQPVAGKEAAIREYLELYINSRLKIRQAYDKGFDTLPTVKNEVVSFRSQIIDNYMTDPDILKRLTAEAFARSQKDIHAAHIFISYKNIAGIADSAEAAKRLEAVQARLKKGEDFLKVAADLSEDPSAKNNKGDLGYVTVFTLPYEVENAIYVTPVNGISAVLRSKTGYHLFKNLGERKAAGKMKAQQILLAIPPESGNRDDIEPIAITNGSEKSPIKSQLISDAGPAILAVIAGRTRIPAPSTAPIVKAAPWIQVILFLSSTCRCMSASLLLSKFFLPRS